MKKIAVMVDPGHGRYYDADEGLKVRTTGGQADTDPNTPYNDYREADAVLSIANRVVSYLQRQTGKVREVRQTRPDLWDIDENAMNSQVGCYNDNKINVGNETCRLGFRAFDERAKRTKKFSAQHYKDEVVFVSIHTEPNRYATNPECRYVYDNRHEKLDDCHKLGQKIIMRLTKIAQNAPTDRGAYEKSMQILWFAGVDLTQTEFTSEAYYTAEQKKRVFSAFEDPDPKKRIRVPAIVAECYSHGKVEWAELLLTDSHRQALAEAIAKGTLDYYDAKLNWTTTTPN